MVAIVERKCVACKTVQDCIWYGNTNETGIYGFICENCFYEKFGLPDGEEQ